MLKQRILTALALIPVVMWAILFAPSPVYQGLVLAVVVLAAIEWFALIKLQSRLIKAILVAIIPIAALLMSVNYEAMFILTMLLWIMISAFVIFYANRPLPDSIQKWFQNPVFGMITAIVVLTLFLFAMVWLHNSAHGAELVIYVLVSVWLADTGGYFAGKRWGKHKLAVQISPNKTWEGVAGAVVLVSLWSIAAYFYAVNVNLSLLSWLGLSAIVVFASIVGDLFESLFKRAYQVKDSGNLLPGHGGMLDRVDSLLAAVPTFTACLYFVGGM
jgi:phosphatidate cytidylyltransferase